MLRGLHRDLQQDSPTEGTREGPGRGSALKWGQQAKPCSLTSEDFCLLSKDGWRASIIDRIWEDKGDMTSLNGTRHQSIFTHHLPSPQAMQPSHTQGETDTTARSGWDLTRDHAHEVWASSTTSLPDCLTGAGASHEWAQRTRETQAQRGLQGCLVQAVCPQA